MSFDYNNSKTLNEIKIVQETKSEGTLYFEDLIIKCTLGRNGIKKNKIEGDGSTPAGLFHLREIFYRQDKVTIPFSNLKTNIIKKNYGWCDEPSDTNYNKKVILPYHCSTESLWRNDDRYDIVIVLGHNDEPVVSGMGSAIFIHVTNSLQKPTEGCIAVKKVDLIDIINKSDKNTLCNIAYMGINS
ncbi:MAG: L,D-transpeptidase family protein [Pseudomonadota bacterium]|nr:L,D-transpeptidase family protein [Pseudomonadota bacterium]